MLGVNPSPDHQLRVMMTQYDLHPKIIIWDGNKHRLPGAGKKKGDAGWYRAYPNRRGAIFGDYSTSLEVNFGAKHDKPPSAHEKKLWKAQDNERKKVRIQAHARARKEVEKVWGEASRDPSSHPYLVNKGIDQDFEDLRVSTKTQLSETTVCQEGMLLVPMRLDGELVALQRIYHDGKKLAWKDAPNFGAATLIGADRWDEVKNNRIYVCEGWATGWTIAQATKNVVVVAFSKDGLLPVTQRLQKQFSKAKFVIVADNDRWTTVQQKKGEPGIPNPGVIFARVAAEETGSAFVIPDFEDLTGRPTDFDDLRMREGMEIVKVWLDPKMAKRAVTEPLESRAEQEAEAPGVDEPEWVTTAPFRCLGVDNSVYYYMTKAVGQVIGIPSSGHTNEGRMMELCPNITWWEQHFPGKQGIDWRLARGAIMSLCQVAGIYDPDRIRGRGCHRNDDGKLVMHLGDRLLPPHKAKYTAPETYDGENRIYPRARRLAGPAGSDPMTLREARNLLAMFQSRAWEDDAAGALLAGWTVLAPFCGWLRWRPHVWVTGPRGCGKSTIVFSMVRPLLGGMCLAAEGMTTEAGLRQHLKHDALPVICEEAEQSSQTAKQQVRGILRLLRSASSAEARALKGSSSGKGVSYEVRIMFLLASISVGLQDEADKSRVTVLQMKNPKMMDQNERRLDWIDFEARMKNDITPEVGRRLIARTARWIRSGDFERLLKVVQSAANIVMGDARAGDQYGTLLAGAWTLMTDEMPKQEEVIACIKDMGITGYTEEAEDDGYRLLDVLLQAKEIVSVESHDTKRVTVGEMIDAVIEGDSVEKDKQIITKREADIALRQLGIRVKPDEGKFFIANTSEWVRTQLRDTPYANGWKGVLRTIDGAEAVNAMRFHTTLKLSRATSLQIDKLRASAEVSE